MAIIKTVADLRRLIQDADETAELVALNLNPNGDIHMEFDVIPTLDREFPVLCLTFKIVEAD